MATNRSYSVSSIRLARLCAILCSLILSACEAPKPVWSEMRPYTALTNPSAASIMASLRGTPAFRNKSDLTAHHQPCDQKRSLDFRNYFFGGKPMLPPVSDQGTDCNSCWVHATASAIDSSRSYLNKQATTELTSKQELLDCSVDFARENQMKPVRLDCRSGLPDVPLRYAEIRGTLSYSEYPQTPGQYDPKKNATSRNMCLLRDPQTNTDMTARSHITTWNFVANEGTSIASTVDLKRALCEHGGLISWVNGADWMSYKAKPGDNTPVRIVGKQTSESSAPLTSYAHIVQIVGWQDDKELSEVPGVGRNGYWIIKNSWGLSWGNEGYALLRYDHEYVGLYAAWIHAEPVLRADDETN